MTPSTWRDKKQMPRGIPKGFKFVKRYRPKSHFENFRILSPNKDTRIIIGRLKKKYRVEGKKTRGSEDLLRLMRNLREQRRFDKTKLP